MYAVMSLLSYSSSAYPLLNQPQLTMDRIWCGASLCLLGKVMCMILGMGPGLCLGNVLRYSRGSSTSFSCGTASWMMVAAVVMSVVLLGSCTTGPLILKKVWRKRRRWGGQGGGGQGGVPLLTNQTLTLTRTCKGG